MARSFFSNSNWKARDLQAKVSSGCLLQVENVVEVVGQKSRPRRPFHTKKVFAVSIKDLPGIIFAHFTKH